MDATAPFFADHAWHGSVRIVEHVPLARDTWRLRVECPLVARRIVPGQFVMLRLPNCNDPLLGRPLALYDTYDGPDGLPAGIDVVYLAIGKFTRRVVAARPGDTLDLWGPLGNGFSPHPSRHLVMVAGGIGQTPFLALAREALAQRRYGDPPRSTPPTPSTQRVTLCYGTRTADLLAGLDDFRRLGVEVRTSTDDGSAGHHGLVTDLLRQVLAESSPHAPREAAPQSSPHAPREPAPLSSPHAPREAAREGRSALRVVCCGPEKMMAATAEICLAAAAPCEVSLESPMACGIGICFSCVAKVRDDRGAWDYRRTCVEGPVFDASHIIFN